MRGAAEKARHAGVGQAQSSEAHGQAESKGGEGDGGVVAVRGGLLGIRSRLLS